MRLACCWFGRAKGAGESEVGTDHGNSAIDFFYLEDSGWCFREAGLQRDS